MRLTGTFVLVLSVFVFAGSASAGNGNGNGKGNQGAAPGNSANAPGQVKKDAPPEAAASTTTSAAPTTTAQQTTTAAAANATGVKPSNSTAHDTHAEAQSDKTKEYGNGQTAGQIAEKNGAAGNAVLHGPGNSQPHKVVPCSGRKHEVDVHALKSHGGGSCDGPAPHPNPTPDPVPPTVVTTTTTPALTTTTEGKPPVSDPGSKPVAGGVKSSPGGKVRNEGVLSATQRIGHAATLPFTGQRLWIVVLVGLILILTGLALREIRTTEAAVESGHDHTDRSRDAARSSAASIGGRPGR